MKATIENGILTIKIDLEQPRLSSTGKTILVASETSKNVATFEEHPLTVAVNAYYKA